MGRVDTIISARIAASSSPIVALMFYRLRYAAIGAIHLSRTAFTPPTLTRPPVSLFPAYSNTLGYRLELTAEFCWKIFLDTIVDFQRHEPLYLSRLSAGRTAIPRRRQFTPTVYRL
jgi:hypothetical protein